MSGRLDGKVAIVTGGAAGVADTAGALKRLEAPDVTHGLRADVARFDDCRRMVDETRQRFGRIDVLVNNAAVFATLKPTPMEAIAEAEWDRVMAVNVKGIWNGVASAIAHKGTAGLLHYVTSKGAVIAMTRALARELGPDTITVNAVAPGLTMSDSVLANPDISAFQREAVLASRSLKREAVAEDLEGTVVFLASDDSAFMTGETLVVDGGSVFS